jgi:NADH:ubiquinone oxidoreductase subunit
MNLNIIFTWWNRQTVGTFLKTLFFGNYVGRDEFGNKYYKNKNDERWVIYSNKVEATKITSEWYLWIHHTINSIPEIKAKRKYLWQKKHQENQTGSINSFKPIKIKKNEIKKKYETWKSN